MAAAAISPKTSDVETVVDFSPEDLQAPFVLRCAALTIDYIILLAFPVGWLLLSKFLSDTGTVTIGPTVWVVGVVIFLVDFLVLPAFRGQTVGKMLVGLTILNIDGTYLGIGGVLRRNILGYIATVLTGGIGFLITAVNASGRALHDFTAKTIVVRGRRTQL